MLYFEETKTCKKDTFENLCPNLNNLLSILIGRWQRKYINYNTLISWFQRLVYYDGDCLNIFDDLNFLPPLEGIVVLSNENTTIQTKQNHKKLEEGAFFIK